jgi:outer membrane lipoprotein-sorting protein
VSNFLRRLPRSRLLLLCATVLGVGIGATALAVALGTGPVPPPKPLAQAVHDALAATPVDGVSARVQFTDHLLEGASLASQGGGGNDAASSPLLTGAAGRLWIAADGRVRLELQAEQGDTQILYDGHTLTLYDAASNSLYRYTPTQGSGEESGESGESGAPGSGGSEHKIPTVSEIQEAIVHIMRHANLSGAVPTDVAGQPAYAVRISPSHDGGLVGGAELAFDAVRGVPLRLAVYSTQSAAPVLELSATEVSYGAVPASVFEFDPPADAKVTEVQPPGQHSHGEQGSKTGAAKPTHERGLAATQAALPFTLDAPASLAGMTRDEVQGAQIDGHAGALIAYGQGLGGIAVIESIAKSSAASGEEESQSPLGELPKVALPGGASASELPTPLGTLLRFRRSGVQYILAGSVTPATLQEAAKGL